MVQKHIVIPMIAAVAVAGILIMIILAATVNAQQPVAGCGPGTDNSTCPTTSTPSLSSSTPTSGCGPGTDNSTCPTTSTTQKSSNTTSPSGSTANNATSPSGLPPPSNNQTTDLANSILAVHNSERAAVGVPPLVWNNTLAAQAKAWAEHLATTGEFAHSTCCGAFTKYGENLAGFINNVSEPNGGQSLWVAEKNHYDGGPLPPDTPASGPQAIGHYTQMVWRTTTSVGCGTASGGGHPFSILVCQYSPPGNIFGQKPY
jgi:uncharacterized protein YkwD